jgi:hypothetical protein
MFTIFTTQGIAQMVNENVEVYTLPDQPYSNTIYTANTSSIYDYFIGNVDCETTTPNVNGAYACVEKGNVIFPLNPYNYSSNPKYMNLYTVNKIYTLTPLNSPLGLQQNPARIVLDKSINSAWEQSSFSTNTSTRLYIFTPQDRYNYVSECSNRGLCDTDLGDCGCFTGYIGDDCSAVDNSLSLDFASLNAFMQTSSTP